MYKQNVIPVIPSRDEENSGCMDTSLINLITDKKNLSSIYNKIAIPAKFSSFYFLLL